MKFRASMADLAAGEPSVESVDEFLGLRRLLINSVALHSEPTASGDGQPDYSGNGFVNLLPPVEACGGPLAIRPLPAGCGAARPRTSFS
jgi:hypothetical protein